MPLSQDEVTQQHDNGRKGYKGDKKKPLLIIGGVIIALVLLAYAL